MQSKPRTILSIVTVIIATIVFHYFGWLAPIENFIRSVMNPASRAVYSLSIAAEGATEEFASVDELKAAYRALKDEQLRTKIDAIQQELLAAENKELRRQLNFFSDRTYEHVGAHVIGKNIDPLGSTIVIDRGARDRVQRGNPVVVSGGALVGIVASVEDDMAVVRLIADNQSKIAATAFNRDHSIGLVEGGFGLSVQMNFIPQNEEVNIGDSIITSGLTKEIPRGLFIGTVAAVEREAYQPFQRAILSPAASEHSLTLVI